MSRGQNRFRGHPAGLALLALALVVGPLASCSAPTRTKVLSFFFDGVPGSASAPQPRGGGMRQRMAGIPAPKATPRPGPPPIVSTHKPVQERQCRLCHQSNRGYYESIGVDERLCDRCHRELRISQGWNHGPINLGTCLPCHRAHESPYPHLLDKPVPDLCLECHKEDVERTPKYHQVANLNQCTACHSPHRVGPGTIKSIDHQTSGSVKVNTSSTSTSMSTSTNTTTGTSTK